jgi:hypothetical protein
MNRNEKAKPSENRQDARQHITSAQDEKLTMIGAPRIRVRSTRGVVVVTLYIYKRVKQNHQSKIHATTN